MKREGHVIANHTAHHRALTYMGAGLIENEVTLNQEMLDEALGSDTVTMTIFRPPYGLPWTGSVPKEEKVRVGNVLKKYCLVVLWTYRFDSTDSWEWAKGEWFRSGPRIDTDSPEFIAKKKRIYRRVVNNASGTGFVVLFHDTHNTTAEILPDIIRGLKAKGYVFATMEDYVIWKYGMTSSEIISLMN